MIDEDHARDEAGSISGGMSGLYDTDILAWSEREAELLRRIAAGERVMEDVDWPNVIDEIESVGRYPLVVCTCQLRHGMFYLLKLYLQPDSPARRHWLQKTDTSLFDAHTHYSPSMRQRIDLQFQYARAVRQLAIGQAEPDLLDLPKTCSWTLDELLADPPDLAGLVATLTRAAAP